jgi:hypothetical protein
MNTNELMERARNVLEQEGSEFDETQKSPTEVLKDFILPALKSSKDVLGSIYSFRLRDKSGIIGKLKNSIQSKLVNTTINVIEKQSMKQQKFNELTYKAIEKLMEENDELRRQIVEIKDQR